MYRKLILATLILGLVAGALVTRQAGQPPAENRPLLDYVPADTAFYVGANEPSLGDELTPPVFELLDRFVGAGRKERALDDLARAQGPAAAMLAGLRRRYAAARAHNKPPRQRLGIDQETAAALYTSAGMPVLRVRLADSRRFRQLLNDIEAAAGIAGQSAVSGDVERGRRYPWRSGGAAGALFIAVRDGYAVAGTSAPEPSRARLRRALGLAPPEQSLRDTDRLADLADKHDTLAAATGFIDHQRLLRMAADPETGVGVAARRWLPALPTGRAVADILQDEACAQGARTLAATWPYTVFGLRQLDGNTGEVIARVAVPATRSRLISDLRDLRGHIPEAVDTPPRLGFGLGFDIETVASMLTRLRRRLSEIGSGCLALQRIQRTIAAYPLRRIEPITRTLADVRGVAMAFESSGSTGVVEPIPGDAVIEVATPEPEMLWQFAQSSLGLATTPRPTSGGEPRAVSLPALSDTALRVAIRENAFIVLIGNAQLGAEMGEAGVAANGVARLRFERAALRDVLARLNASPVGELNPAPQAARDYDLRLDIADTGIRLDIHAGPPQAN